jgi:hypothetical protein
VLNKLPAANEQALTGQQFFPNLISGPFHDGLVIVFWMAIALSVVGAVASLLPDRARRRAPDEASRDLGRLVPLER